MSMGENKQRMEQALWRRCPAAGRFLAWCSRSDGMASNEDGATLVEFALTASAMLAFVFMIMQLCIAFYSSGMINEVAREATRWAITRGSTCQTASLGSCTTTTAAVTAYANGLGFPNIGGGTMNVVTSFPDTNGSIANCETPSLCHVKVVITYVVPITLPLVPKNSISLSTQSEMYFVQ